MTPTRSNCPQSSQPCVLNFYTLPNDAIKPNYEITLDQQQIQTTSASEHRRWGLARGGSAIPKKRLTRRDLVLSKEVEMKHTVLPWTSRVQMQSGTKEVEWETTPTNPQWAKKAKEGRWRRRGWRRWRWGPDSVPYCSTHPLGWWSLIWRVFIDCGL